MRNLLYALNSSIVIHPKVIRSMPPDATSPALWPFNLERNRFARNPFTTCSCLLCKWDKKVEPTRAREKRTWRASAGEFR